MAKKKGNRTEEARRGTKADPERADNTRVEEMRRQLELDMGPAKLNRRPSWYIKPLDKEKLSDEETTTHRLYIVAEVLLFTNIVLRLVILATKVTELSPAGFQELLASDSDAMISLLAGLFQIFGGSIILSCYKRYLEGNVGPILYSLVMMLVGEVGLGDPIGVVCVAVLLWRSRDRCSSGLPVWRKERKFWGKVSDCAYAFIFLIVALMLALAKVAS